MSDPARPPSRQRNTALLGAVVGTAGAYLAIVAVWHRDLSPLDRVLLAHLLTLVVGLPVLATVAGWLLAGREPPGFARRELT